MIKFATVNDIVRIICLIFNTLATIAAAAVGWMAYQEYVKDNKASARLQLYQAERELYRLEVEKEYLQSIYADVSFGEGASVYIKKRIALTMYDNSEADLPTNLSINRVEDLYKYIWSDKFYDHENNAKLRSLFLHCEAYLYHIDNAYVIAEENYIDEIEWDTWKNLAKAISLHPVCLAAVYVGELELYFSESFADWYRKALKDSTDHQSILEVLYPEMLKCDWPKKFKRPEPTTIWEKSRNFFSKLTFPSLPIANCTE